MRCIIIFSLLISTLAVVQSVAAEGGSNQPKLKYSPGNQIEITPMNSLETLFLECIDSSDCEPYERMELIQKLEKESHRLLQQIAQDCTQLNFKGCVAPGRIETRQWHQAQNYMNNLMISLEESPLDDREDAEKWENWFRVENNQR